MPSERQASSGSKSGLRHGLKLLRRTLQRSKTAHEPSHPKQPRVQRPAPPHVAARRRTNGWVPVGAACEKAVYVLVSASSQPMGKREGGGRDWDLRGGSQDFISPSHSLER